MNVFENMNKVFYFYGLESDTKGKLIQKLLLLITIVNMVFDVIFWITIYLLDLKSMFHTSWAIKMVIRIISFVLYVSRHAKLIECAKKINGQHKDKCLTKVSIVLIIVWLASFACMVPSVVKWTKDEAVNDTLGLGDERHTLVVFTIINAMGLIYGFGIGIMQLLVYFQTHYIIYRIRTVHYENLSRKILNKDYLRVRRLRMQEIEIRQLEQKFNDLLGFIPVLWMTELFVRLVIGITNIAVSPISPDDIILYFFDTIIFHSILLTVIILVGYLDNKFDCNTIIALVNKAFGEKPSNDLSFELEMIKYMSELSSRSQNPTKSLGLFTINGQFILISANAVISFSVMFIQLIQ